MEVNFSLACYQPAPTWLETQRYVWLVLPVLDLGACEGGLDVHELRLAIISSGPETA